MASVVSVVKTRPETVVEDYKRAMELAGWTTHLTAERDLLLKLNLSWTKYFPACSSQPWQLEGVLKTLLDGAYTPDTVIPIENKTVVTEPWKGAKNNQWLPVLDKYKCKFQPLTEVAWKVHSFKADLLKLNHIFPEGILIPSIYEGKDILHLPTVKTHGHSITTGAIKNAFGGLLKEVRHYAHKYIHEVMVEQFQQVWAELAPHAAARGLSLHEVVTLASIVEKETGAAEERPRIASVFANRIARRMRLESDPTVIYGIPDFDGNLRRRDLENEAP